MAGKPLALQVKICQGADLQRERAVGYIIKGEAGPIMKDKKTGLPGKQNKHCAHVFREPACIEEQVITVHGEKEFDKTYLESILDSVLDLYEKNEKSIYKEYRRKYAEFKEGKGNRFFPVYYSLLSYGRDKKYVDSLMLSPACITREIYTRMLSDMAGDKKILREIRQTLSGVCIVWYTPGK